MDHKIVTEHSDPHVYDGGELAHTAHEIAETKIQYSRTVDLYYHRRSKILAIQDFFPRHHAGDVFLVCGKTGETQRQIVHISVTDVGATSLTKTVVARAAALFEKFSFSDLDVFIVPSSGLSEKPDTQRKFHFSISTDAEWNRLLTPQGDHSAKGHRELDADRLLEILNTAAPRAKHTGKSRGESGSFAGAEMVMAI